MLAKIYGMFGGTATDATSPNDYKQAMRLVAAALGDDYIVYGSGACLLHGVEFEPKAFPGDIDIAVLNIAKARNALKAAAAKGLFKNSRTGGLYPCSTSL